MTLAYGAVCAIFAVITFLSANFTTNFLDTQPRGQALLLWLLLIALVGLYVVQTQEDRNISPGRVWPLACFALACMVISYPVGSRDVFLYAFYGKMWAAYGANPYLQSPAQFPNDSWQPYLQASWRDWTTLYGPLFIWQCRLMGSLVGDHPWVSVWLHKITAATLLVAVWFIQTRRPRGDGQTAGTVLLLLWNPLLLFEIGSGAHNEIGMLLCVTGVVVASQRGWFATAIGILAMSFWYKWYGILLLPSVLVELFQKKGWKRSVGGVVLFLVIAIALGLCTLVPLPDALPAIVAELFRPKVLQVIWPTELPPLVAGWFWALRGLGALDQAWGYPVFHFGRVLGFLVCSAAILLRQLRCRKEEYRLIESMTLIALAFTMVLLTILWPWYLIVPIGLALMHDEAAFHRLALLLTGIGMLSYMLTFSVATIAVVLILLALQITRAHRPEIKPRAT